MIYFLSKQTILHPETRKVLTTEGELETIQYMKALAKEYGIDNIEGTLLFAKSFAHADKIVRTLGK